MNLPTYREFPERSRLGGAGAKSAHAPCPDRSHRVKVDGRQMSKGRDEHIIYNVKKCLKIAAAGAKCSVVASQGSSRRLAYGGLAAHNSTTRRTSRSHQKCQALATVFVAVVPDGKGKPENRLVKAVADAGMDAAEFTKVGAPVAGGA
jgi:hypothetical protein